MDKPPKHRAVSLLFQFVLILLTSLIVGVCIYRSFSYFSPNEAPVVIEKLTPKLLEQLGGHPGIITAGVTIDDYLVFDPVKDDFTFIGTVWFEFDPAMITLDILGKFRFNRAEIKEKSEPDARIINNRFLVRYTVKVSFKNQLSYQYFPFDDHQLSLQLINPYVSANEIIFESVASNFDIRAMTNTIGWTLIDKDVSAGVIPTQINAANDTEKNIYYPGVFFILNYLRTGIRYAITILLPLLALFFISLFSFSLNPIGYDSLAITLSAASVTGILAYRFVIENLSPAVGYFMVSDYIFFLFLILVSVIFVFCILLKRIPLWGKHFLIVAAHAIICAFFIYLTFVWMR